MLASYRPGFFRSFNWSGPKKITKAEKKHWFNVYAMNLCDNLKTGELGWVRDFDGGLYEISKARRSARRLAANDPAHQIFIAASL